MSKGLTLAIIGVSNGAIQFMTYEEMKKRRVELRRARLRPGASEEEIKTLVRSDSCDARGRVCPCFAADCILPRRHRRRERRATRSTS